MELRGIRPRAEILQPGVDENMILVSAMEFIALYEIGNEFAEAPWTKESATPAAKSVYAMDLYPDLRDLMQVQLNEVNKGSSDPIDIEKPVTVAELRDRNTAVAIVTRNPSDKDRTDAYGLTIFFGYEPRRPRKFWHFRKSNKRNETALYATTINIGTGKFKKELVPLPGGIYPTKVTYKTRHLILPDDFKFQPINEGKLFEVDLDEQETVAGRRTKQGLVVGGVATGFATVAFATTQLALRTRKS